MAPQERSAFDKDFLDTVKLWFTARNDIFVVVRASHTAGGRTYFWFQQFDTFRRQLDTFPSQADVIVLRNDQFPIRGTVNDDLIHRVLNLIPDKTEMMVTTGIKPPDKNIHVWACDTHAELLESLYDRIGEDVSVGFYAPWHEAENEKMISALIPLPDGTLKRGVY